MAITKTIGHALTRGLRSDLAIAIGDQGLLSLFSFGLNLFLIRALDADAYGAFALWLSIALFAVSLQNATVTTPLSVYVPGQRDRRLAQRLERSIATVNWGFVAVAVGATAAAAALMDRAWLPGDFLLVAIPAYVGATLLREFARGFAFARAKLHALAGIDGAYVALAALGLGAAFAGGIGGDGLLAAVFLVIAGGAVVGAAIGLLRFRRQGARFWQRGWRDTYRSIRVEVGWSLAGVVATHGQARSYVYVVSALAGPEALAVTFALGILFQPVRLVAEAWARVARPRLARLMAERDGRAALLVVWHGMALLVAGLLALAVALFVLWPGIDALVFGHRYEGGENLLLPWTVATLAFVVRSTVSVLLQAARAFRVIFRAIAISAVATLLAAAGLTVWFGYAYCLYGLAIGELVCLLLLIRAAMPLVTHEGPPRMGASGRTSPS